MGTFDPCVVGQMGLDSPLCNLIPRHPYAATTTTTRLIRYANNIALCTIYDNLMLKSWIGLERT